MGNIKATISPKAHPSMGADDWFRRWPSKPGLYDNMECKPPGHRAVAAESDSPSRDQLDEPSRRGSSSRDMKSPESNRGRDQAQPKGMVNVKPALLTIHTSGSQPSSSRTATLDVKTI